MQSSQDKLTYEFTEMKYDMTKIDSDIKKRYSDMNEKKKMFTQMTKQKQNYLLDKKDSTKEQDTTAVVPTNNKSPSLEVGNYTNSGGMQTIKHKIRSPELY